MTENKPVRGPSGPVEELYWRYLQESPLSYALWRSLEYKVLHDLDFRSPVLDLGCGEGLFSSLLFKEQVRVGMDLNFEEVLLASRFNKHDLLLAADGTKLPFCDASFRTVFSNCVIEHIPGVENLISEVYRVLEPGGRFISTVPGERFAPNLFFSRLFESVGLKSAAEAYGVFMNRLLGHENIFTNEGWADQLRAAGFQIETLKPIISAAGIRAFDIGSYFAYRSYLIRKVFHKWVIAPWARKLWVPIIFALSKKLLYDERDVGGGLLLIGEKPGGVSSTAGDG